MKKSLKDASLASLGLVFSYAGLSPRIDYSPGKTKEERRPSVHFSIVKLYI